MQDSFRSSIDLGLGTKHKSQKAKSKASKKPTDDEDENISETEDAEIAAVSALKVKYKGRTDPHNYEFERHLYERSQAESKDMVTHNVHKVLGEHHKTHPEMPAIPELLINEVSRIDSLRHGFVQG